MRSFLIPLLALSLLTAPLHAEPTNDKDDKPLAITWTSRCKRALKAVARPQLSLKTLVLAPALLVAAGVAGWGFVQNRQGVKEGHDYMTQIARPMTFGFNIDMTPVDMAKIKEGSRGLAALYRNGPEPHLAAGFLLYQAKLHPEFEKKLKKVAGNDVDAWVAGSLNSASFSSINFSRAKQFDALFGEAIELSVKEIVNKDPSGKDATQGIAVIGGVIAPFQEEGLRHAASRHLDGKPLYPQDKFNYGPFIIALLKEKLRRGEAPPAFVKWVHEQNPDLTRAKAIQAYLTEQQERIEPPPGRAMMAMAEFVMSYNDEPLQEVLGLFSEAELKEMTRGVKFVEVPEAQRNPFPTRR